MFMACGVFYVNFMPNWMAGQSVALLEAFFIFAVLAIARTEKQEGMSWFFTGALSALALTFVLANALAAIEGVAMASWSRVFHMVLHLVFAVVFLRFLLSDAPVSSLVAKAVLLAVPVYAMFLITAWVGMEVPEQHDWMNKPPLFRHIRHLAYFLCIGMVTAAWASLAWQGGWRGAAMLTFCLVTSIMLWSGSRGAFLAASIGILTLSIGFPLRRCARVWLVLLFAVWAAMLVSALFPVDQSGVGWLSAFMRSDQASSINQLSSGRLGIWTYLVPFIAERPWFGWGAEGFLSVWEGFPIRQAHNGVMQLLIEWGAAGAALFLLIIGWLSFKGGKLYMVTAKAGKTTVTLAYGVSLLTALLTLALTDGIFYFGMPMTYLMIACAFIGGELIRHKRVDLGSKAISDPAG
ncbi:O-antigen ligase [Pseudomonas linyingensis]|uniref:O-antigen ligase n=2 Tax=Pseudomonas linyingensis TaxID=915471 RepID=A0A1H6S4C2_9PSED|nr:O-antigen ligase [Pseudomonas linyingensis]